jgi:polar amino acid transport system substrate-binding protein
VPQAVRIVMPPVTSDFIALFKDTSVCSAITVIELTKRYSVLALSTGRIVELAVVTAVLYLCMSWPLALLSRWFERRLERPAAGGTEG